MAQSNMIAIAVYASFRPGLAGNLAIQKIARVADPMGLAGFALIIGVDAIIRKVIAGWIYHVDGLVAERRTRIKRARVRSALACRLPACAAALGF